VRTESNAIEPTTVSDTVEPQEESRTEQAGGLYTWIGSIVRVRRRYVIVLLALAVGLSAAVPAIGGNGVFGLANHALKVAKKGRKKAKKARQAGRENARALNKTNQAVDQTNQTLNSTQVVSDVKSATVTTSSESYVAKGGPSVTVTVPKSGLIDVWAHFDTNDADGGAVSLYEDGKQVPGQADCDPDVQNALVLVEGSGSPPGNPISASTPAAVDVAFGCVTFGAPGPVQFQRPPGQHTYELRYADPCPCVGSQFSNRTLRVGPRL
jgi:hypothetical protein